MAAEGVKNEPRPSDAPSVPSTERVSIARLLPGEWLDRLLIAHCAVRAETPLDEAVTLHLNAVRELFEDAALGVCIPHAAEGSRTGQLVIRLAPTRSSHATEPDPARLFPELAYERVVPIHAEEGATLHAASDDEVRFSDGSPATALIERAAWLISTLLEQRRAQDRALDELRAQVIQTDKLASLGQIAAGIVHELNNPLTTIVAYSEFLRKKMAATVDADDLRRLASINEAGERILRFSRDLTAYSRPANETPSPVAIHDVIDRALNYCEHEINKTGVLVERNLGEVPAVRGVAAQLTQVFVNLFTNAAHAMQESGSTLRIATQPGEEEVEIAVSDDGSGIEVEQRERIFEPFFTTKTDGTGTGLGLSIVRSIVQGHGGRIRVEGNDPRGTVFRVWLPIAARRGK